MQNEIVEPLEARTLVSCRVCLEDGKEARFPKRSLHGHLRKHTGLTKKQYVDRFGPEAENDFYFAPKTNEEISKKSEIIHEVNRQRYTKKREGLAGALDSITEQTLVNLNQEEQAFFSEFVEHATQQTDRDETQLPVITSLAFDLIFIKRLRTKQLLATNRKYDEILVNKDFETVIKQTEDRISKAMDTLGLSRASQIKRGQAIKSTPAAIISGYLDELERCTPEVLDALMLEEKRLYAKMQARIEKYILSDAPDISKEEADADNGRELTFEEAVARAGMVTGGSEQKIITDEGRDLPF